jgi:hypothetical protein
VTSLPTEVLLQAPYPAAAVVFPAVATVTHSLLFFLLLLLLLLLLLRLCNVSIGTCSRACVRSIRPWLCHSSMLK